MPGWPGGCPRRTTAPADGPASPTAVTARRSPPGQSPRCGWSTPRAPASTSWSTPPSEGDDRVVRGAGPAHQRRHLHPGPPPRLRRRGRPGRGAGGLPAGLPVHREVPRRRAVHHLALPHHRQLRLHPPRAAAPAPARRARRGGGRARHQTRTRPARSRPTPRCSADQLEAAIAELPPRLRAVVVLRDIYDLNHAEIADELGISESAAKVRLHRARRRLRTQVFPLAGEPPPRPRSTPMPSERVRDRAGPSAVVRGRRRPAPRRRRRHHHARPRRPAPRRALPALPGRAGPVPQAPAGHAEPRGPPPSRPRRASSTDVHRPPRGRRRAPGRPGRAHRAARSPTSAASPPRPPRRAPVPPSCW